MKTIIHLTKIVIAFFLISFSCVSFGQNMNSQELYEQLSIALKNPQDRARLKQIISQWTPLQKAEFANSLISQAEKGTAVLLPMKIDKDTTWVSLKFSSTGVFIHVTISNNMSGDPTYFIDNKKHFKNYMCTTPVNALLMIIGYKFYVSYYDEYNSYITQLQYTLEDCES